MHCPRAVTSTLLALTPDRGLPLLKTLQGSPLLPGTVQAPDDLVLALYLPVSTPLPARSPSGPPDTPPPLPPQCSDSLGPVSFPDVASWTWNVLSQKQFMSPLPPRLSSYIHVCDTFLMRH